MLFYQTINFSICFLFPGQPVPGMHSAVQGVAKFDFTAESEDELTLKVCACSEQI